MADYRDGLEAAAREVEQSDPGLLGGEVLKALAERIRTLPVPEGGSMIVAPSDLDLAFGRFQEVYLSIGGFRQPNDKNAKGWDAARSKFRMLVKKKKHNPEAIISGTQAFAATRPDAQFVPAPEGFLHREQFMKDWGRAVRVERRHVSLQDVEEHFLGKIGHQ